MDRYVVLAHLAAAERHIAEGQARLERQEQLVAKLERNGRETKEAIAILATMKQTQELHLQDRDRILDELGR
jgi:hypothetical protein